MTVDDFKKLIELERRGLWVHCDGSRVRGLCYDDETDPEEFVLPAGCNDPRELCCTFMFEDDLYTTVQYLSEHRACAWAVMKPVWIEDWRTYEG